MPFSHHSHSGQFCPGHAVDSLENIVETAIAKGFEVYALTEHMPRHEQDFYPEEIKAGLSLSMHYENEAAYFKEAQKLRDKYRTRIEILVGFESEWCGSHSLELIERSLQTFSYDFFVGSLHHVRGVPIDYDRGTYNRVRDELGGTDQTLFNEYYDEQLTMLQALRPPVVGHFDLIKLMSSDSNVNWKMMNSIWPRILRNLDFVASYGGLLEINTAALRKGLNEPYPSSEICQVGLLRLKLTTSSLKTLSGIPGTSWTFLSFGRQSWRGPNCNKLQQVAHFLG